MSLFAPVRLLTVIVISMLSLRASAEETTINFENVEIGKPLPNYVEQDVRFELAHAPKKSAAKGRIMFFPHLGDDHKGILNAMADEAIPLRISFPRPAAKAALTLWGSTTSAAVAEAFSSEGKLVARAELKQVPVRKSPEEHVPYFVLSLESPGMTTIEVSGSQPGGFIAVDEIHIFYEETLIPDAK